MPTRRFLFFLLIFGLLFIDAPVSLAQDKAAPQPSNQEQEDRLKRERKAVALLDEVVSESQALKLPENRIRVQVVAGDLLWERNQSRARALFGEAAIAIAQANDQTDREDRDESETVARLRRELVLTVAQHDADLAFQLLNSSRPLSRTGDTGNDLRLGRDETNLTQSLLSIIASSDPHAAYQKSIESLDKGEYPAAIGSVLRQLYLKDKEVFDKLSKKVLSRLTSSDLIAREEAGNLAVDLLYPGPISESSAAKPTSAQPPRASGRPSLSEAAYRDLMDAVITAALTAGPDIPPRSQDAMSIFGVDVTTSARGAMVFTADNGRSGFFLQPASATQPNDEQGRPHNARMLLTKLQQLLPRIDQYSSDRAQALRQKSIELGINNNELTVIDLDQSTSESLMTAAGSAPSQIQSQIYKQAAQKAIDEGNTERALKIATDHLDESARNAIKQALEFKKMALNAAPDKLAKLRQKLAALPSDSARVMAIADVAAAIAKDDPKLALTLLGDARNIVSKRAKKYQDFADQLKVAEAFAALDLKQSFDVLDSGIAQLNEILAAAAVVNGFEAEVFCEEELPIQGDSELARMLGRYGWELGSLALLDFEHAGTTADKFQIPEAKILAKLLIAERVLGGQQKSFGNLPGEETFRSFDK